ncbi:class I SAM-dependent methyltransferase [Robertmurraya massiliosenegalensis]|uniref:class I SAM-dependent methyltransferase n=1 Tax=Robertmurraya massiliosenegalensis TaxID=1287657 RepID=UPI0002F10298|nr:class I SAM-dependent methyltransferase [Robertmurraya massiliosenegalensis]
MTDSIYDQLNKWDVDDEFFLRIIEKVNPETIGDLGCGTGRLTIPLGEKGYRMSGYDPDGGAIREAIKKDINEFIDWHIGTAKDMPTEVYDMVIMTAHVAQEMIGDEEWQSTLHDVYRTLKKDGYVTFDSRNPMKKGWEDWTYEKTRKLISVPKSDSQAEHWHEFQSISNGIVTFKTSLKEVKTNQIIAEEYSQLSFRTRAMLENQLKKAGFGHIEVFGDWEFSNATDMSKEFIVLAKK